MNLWNLELELNAISWLQFFASKSTRKNFVSKCCPPTATDTGKIRSQNVAQIAQIPAAAVRPGRISVLPDLLIFRGFLIFAGFLFFVGFLPGLANLEVEEVWREVSSASIQGSSSARSTVSALHTAQKHNAKLCKKVHNSATRAIQYSAVQEYCSAVHQGPFRCPT